MQPPTNLERFRCIVLDLLATGVALSVLVACADPSTPTHDAARSGSADPSDPSATPAAEAASRASVAEAAAVAAESARARELGDYDVENPGFEQLACSRGGPATAVDVKPDLPFDSIRERRVVETLGPSRSESPGAESGTACATAHDQAACHDKLAAADYSPSDVDAFCAVELATMPGTCSFIYWVYSRGDDVGVATTPAQKAALIGRVDNAEEAVLLAQFEGYDFDCGGRHTKGSSSRPTTTGFELVGSKPGKCDETPKYRVKIAVGFDGAVTELEATSLGITPCTPPMD